MRIVYTVVFAISALLIVLLIANYKNKISITYIILYASLAISNFGSMQMASANNVETAVFANQTNYLGACFSPFLLVMCIADLCKFKIGKVYQAVFAIYATILFTFVSTVGIWPLYYKSVSLEKVYGISILVKEYGPFHWMYPFYLVIMCAGAIDIIVLSIKKSKDVSYNTCFLLLACMLLVIGIYVGEKVFRIKIDLLPFAYIFAQIICMYLLKRVSSYELSAISYSAMMDSHRQGFILYNNKGKYLGSDEIAKKWFPELIELRVDSDIKQEGTPLFNQIGKWMQEESNNEVAYIEKDENLIIEVSHGILKQKKSGIIHCLYLEDETEQMQYTKLVKRYNEDLERDVDKKTTKLRKVQNDIIISMASIVENRDSNTGGHIVRTSDTVNVFVNFLRENYHFEELTEAMAHCIVKAAPLHDFGKIGIPDIVLNKPGKFTEDEYSVMKQHSEKGAVIVEQILRHSDDEFFKKIAINIAHFHHEKWDGSGYPNKLSGIDIPFEARVMALADVFDALVSKRVYKEKFTYDEAFDIIKKSKGSHFDPKLCEAFLQCRPSFEKLYNSYGDA